MISKIGCINSINQTFTGRLFNYDGQQIKSFDSFDVSGGKDKMAERGAPATDIYIKDFISTEDSRGDGYDNSIQLSIHNPLFGSQRFVQQLAHKTNDSVKGCSSSELWHMDLLTHCQRTDDLENKALRGTLIDKVKELATKRDEISLSPTDILANMLQDCDKNEHGFSDKRIGDFQRIAHRLTNELIRKGIDNVEKFQ